MAPALSGTAQRTFTLSVSQGTWDGIGNSYAYQWQRSADGTTWTDITGQTTPSYTLTVGDEGDVIRALVTATNVDGTASAASAPSSIVQSGPPLNTAVPTISGTAQRTSTLTATVGTWSGLSNAYSYQWQRSADGITWTNISNQAASVYTVGTADENTQVRVLVTATNPDGALSVPSAATATIPSAPPVNTALPTITGTAQRTMTLTAGQGTWSGIGNSYSYQWQRSADGTTWTNLTGATNPTYVPTKADERTQVRVLVSATNPDGTADGPERSECVRPDRPRRS